MSLRCLPMSGGILVFPTTRSRLAEVLATSTGLRTPLHQDYQRGLQVYKSAKIELLAEQRETLLPTRIHIKLTQLQKNTVSREAHQSRPEWHR